MARRGNADINSLLRTAQAAQEKQLAFNDQAAAYDWDLSAKTQADLKTYMDYLNKRQGLTTDPSKSLTLQTKKVEANRTYTSAEVGRQTISVLYGDKSNRDKYAAINNLMDQAASTGDASLFQTLDATRARLSKTIQDEEQANASAARSASSAAASRGFSASMNQHDMAIKTLQDAYQSGKPLMAPDASGKQVPVKVAYQNGKPKLDNNGNLVQDPNGQPLQLTAQSYALLHGAALRAKAATLQSAIDGGMDNEQGTKAKDLLDLQSSPDWNNFASDEAFQRNGSNANPFVTKVDANGRRSIGIASTQEKANIGPDGSITYQAVPLEGRSVGKDGNVGDKYSYTANVGSSSNAPIDRFEVTTKQADLGNAPVKVIGGDKIGGYGQQAVFANPNTSPLPSGKPRASDIYVAGDGAADNGTAAIHSVAPLKQLVDASGKPIPGAYGTSNPTDFPAPAGPGGAAAQYISDWKQGASDIAGGVSSLAHELPGALEHTGQALSSLGAGNFAGGVGNALNGVMGMFDHGQQVRAQAAARAAEQQKAAQLAAINQANQQAAAADAARIAQQRAHPSNIYVAPAGPGAYAPISQSSPAQRYQAASGGSQAPSAVARGIGAAVGYNSQPWWKL